MSRNENRNDNGDAVRQTEDFIVPDRASTMLVCIHGGREAGIYGDICSCYLKDAVKFEGAGDLVLKLDRICSWLGAPCSKAGPRFLNRDMEKQYQTMAAAPLEIIRDKQMGGLDQIPFHQALQAREVLAVYIKFRENSSIQGSIRGRLTGGKIVSFRSGLELMRMLCMIQT